MVDFTQNLPNASSSRRIIDPGKSGPSLFGEVADFLSEGITRGARLFEESESDSRQAAASARQAREDARANRERTAKDAVAAAMWEARDRFEQPGAPSPLADNDSDYPIHVPFDNELEGAPGVSADVANAAQPRVDELRRARAAEEQGRAPVGSYRVLLERNISALMAEMPDQTSEIFDYLKEAGFQHYLFRGADADQKWAEATVTQDIAETNMLSEEALKRGLVPLGTDRIVAAGIAQRALDEEYRTKLLRETQAAAAAGNQEARQQYEHNRKLADDEARRNFAANLSAVIQPRWNQLANILTQANGSAEALALMPDAIRGMDIIVENHISAARQGGTSEEVINSMRADWDNMKQSAVSFISGPTSDVGAAKIALEGVQTRLGLQLAEALPTYMALQEVFGATALASIFDPSTGTLTPEMITQARTELRGIQGAIDTDQERVSLATTARILRGNLQITELTERESRAQMPTLIAAVRGQATDVANGSGNINSLVNGNLAVINAAMELQRGNATVDSEKIAVGSLFNPTQRRALHRIVREDPESGRLLAQAGRSSAMHLWTNLQGHRLTDAESGGGLWKVGLDANDRWVARLDPAAYQAWAARQRSGRVTGDPGDRAMAGGAATVGLTTRVPTYEELQRRPPAALNSLVIAQNQVVDYLVDTTQYDPVFQGVDHASARDFYISGRVPAAMQRKAEQDQRVATTVQSQAAAFRQGLDADRVASETLRDNAITGRIANETIPPPEGLVQDTVKRLADDVGVPWEVIDRLVRKESQWDINADSGSSQGLFQLNRPNAGSMTWQENASEGIKEWVASGERAQQVLGRSPNPGEQYVMYQQGAGGGAALLNPANASKLAIDVLRPLYGDAATARSAIIGNGGNLNMTAAQFAKHISDYFNR